MQYKLLDVIGGKPIAVWSQSISGVNAINPLVAFYDIHGRKREVLFFYFVPDTYLCIIRNIDLSFIATFSDLEFVVIVQLEYVYKTWLRDLGGSTPSLAY
jgi:hypothetical protein